ncbi:hypothetical protein CFHF_19895 [Caulobacter flavus]|uniref:Cell envelope biogenesis protein TolA n=1 Tax=Caulobacter flavus TaxID=1679497 RepID=A0A2N5CP42_9CAUL|nr:hypothetical protein [Caulobacter flavus]AYV48568.1 hypothetical protein C1707_21170 [Caulobacter flavus]PLR08715.1 hypothetical protein CFHF_19895 [Caulobacter flavus]
MAKPSKLRLKVFGAQFGFHDTIVAAPSQKAALEAWGIRQNLFAEGSAKIIDDPDAVAAALAHPEVPLRRAVGSKDPFSLEPGLPDVPDAPKPKKADLKLVPKAKARQPERPPPNRAELSAAEKALAAINQQRIDEEAQFQARREALEREETASRQRWSRDRKAAEAALDKARRAYREAGGET